MVNKCSPLARSQYFDDKGILHSGKNFVHQFIPLEKARWSPSIEKLRV